MMISKKLRKGFLKTRNEKNNLKLRNGLYYSSKTVLACRGKVSKIFEHRELRKCLSRPRTTIQNIKEACKRNFNVGYQIYCDVLSGERGPSRTETSRINKWKVIHVHFIEANNS